MTVLAEEFVDALNDPDSLPDFPPTFETLTRKIAPRYLSYCAMGIHCNEVTRFLSSLTIE